jgi:predicted nucleic acid-binding Zn ribbon protein
MDKREGQSRQIGANDIRDLLARVIRKRKWHTRLELHGVFSFWDEVVGEDISGRAQPACIRGSVLWVDVIDSIWMQQLHLQKLLLLDLINRRLDKGAISDIRFKLNSELGSTKPAALLKKPARPIDPEKLQEFEEQLAPLQDKDIKRALLRLWKKYQACP